MTKLLQTRQAGKGTSFAARRAETEVIKTGRETRTLMGIFYVKHLVKAKRIIVSSVK
jgi:hypothetical protein